MITIIRNIKIIIVIRKVNLMAELSLIIEIKLMIMRLVMMRLVTIRLIMIRFQKEK